jgi:DNA-binding NarL/FixJ family response regulator
MRVLVVAEPSMFDEGIEAILRQEPGLEIVGRGADPQDCARLIKEASPDVILVADGGAVERLAAELMGMVRDGYCMRMVEVHLATNSLCVYRGERQSIRQVADLVDAVRLVCGGLNPDSQVPLAPVTGEPAGC